MISSIGQRSMGKKSRYDVLHTGGSIGLIRPFGLSAISLVRIHILQDLPCPDSDVYNGSIMLRISTPLTRLLGE